MKPKWYQIQSVVERSKPDLHGLLEGMFSLEENSAKTNTFVNFFSKYKIFIKMVWQLGHKCKKKMCKNFFFKNILQIYRAYLYNQTFSSISGFWKLLKKKIF